MSHHNLIYPGHAVPVALSIMEQFASYDDAASTGRTFPKWLENTSVNGSPPALRSAMNLLSLVHEHVLTPAEAFEKAQEMWLKTLDASNPAKEAGVVQADMLREAFIDKLATWMQPVQVQAKALASITA